jgi:hypothetical protein
LSDQVEGFPQEERVASGELEQAVDGRLVRGLPHGGHLAHVFADVRPLQGGRR